MTARYSPIAPITLLEKMFEVERSTDTLVLGNYLLLLAHDVLIHPERYENLIIAVRDHYKGGEDTFIIMDNSVVELGNALNVEDVIEAACVVEANCIMTPDILGDSHGTQVLVELQKELLLECNFPLMRVPQGKNNAELVECVDWLRHHLPRGKYEWEYWGIPRWISNELDSRIPIVQYINTASEGARIHLLGCSDNYDDDMRSCWLPDVMGIDSANPLIMGYVGLSIDDGGWRHGERGKYWEYTELDALALENMDTIRNAIKY